MRQSLRVFGVCLCVLAVLGFVGCSMQITDAVPTAINPRTVQVGVNEVATVAVFLTQPRKKEGEVVFNFANPEFVRPASNSGDAGQAHKAKVAVGENIVYFQVQGVTQGVTTIFATLDGFRVSAPVVVGK